MMNQRHCPFCKTAALKGCEHLALAAEGRDFVRRCIERCQGEIPWRTLRLQRQARDWPAEQQDFTWLETAFCDQFLKNLTWFGGLDHEWRSGTRPEQGGFWVLLWSRNPQHLWWELRGELERQCLVAPVGQETPPWLIFLNPR